MGDINPSAFNFATSPYNLNTGYSQDAINRYFTQGLRDQGLLTGATTTAYPDFSAFTKATSLADKVKDFNSQYGSTIIGGLQALGGLWTAYNGRQNTALAKQQMANSLDQWNKNYANQVASYNTTLEDRQNARVAAQGANQQDTASYMAKNRLK